MWVEDCIGIRAVWNRNGIDEIRGNEGDPSWGASSIIKDEPIDREGYSMAYGTIVGHQS
jgi:hypothetical protein